MLPGLLDLYNLYKSALFSGCEVHPTRVVDFTRHTAVAKGSLELEFQCHLENPWIPSRRDLPKIAILKSSIGIAEVDVVENVVEFRSELITNALAYLSSLQ